MAGEAAATRRVGLDDPGYLDLLREYIGKILGEAATPGFADRLIAQAERRFVFVGFLVEQLRGGQVIPETLEALGTGAAIYDRFIDGLEARYGTKRADDLLMVLCCLAAAELAHGWIFGDGAVRDEATGGILEPLPREWPGLELDLLAAAAGMDEIAEGGSASFGAAFVESLILLQGALWVWRGEEGGARYRLGLKELAARLAALRADAVTRAHARLAGLCLDVVAAIDGPLDTEQEPDAWDERTLRGLFPLLPGLVTLAGSETLRHRYSTLPVTAFAFNVEARVTVRSAPSRRQIAWYSAVLAALNHGAGPAYGHLERWESEGSAYMLRGIAKQDAPGYGVLAALADHNWAIGIKEDIREVLGNDWPVPWQSDLANAYANRGNARQDAPGHGALAAIADHDAAIAIMERLREALGDAYPMRSRNNLANAYTNRGNAKQDAPGYGALAAIADYDAAILIIEGLREALGEGFWPLEWRNDLARAYMVRGNTKLNAPRHGALAAIVDCNAAITLMEGLREVLGKDWPIPWRNGLANAYVNRGNAKWAAPGHGALAAIADYDAAITIMKALGEALGEDEPTRWRRDLALAYMNRGNAKQDARGHGALAAIADYDTGIALMEELREVLGEGWPVPWCGELGAAYANRGLAKISGLEQGASAAIPDLDEAIVIMEELHDTLGEGWPVPWRYQLAATYMNRGNAKLRVSGQGEPVAIADYDAAIVLMEGLRDALGAEWPVPWRDELGSAYFNRARAHLLREDRSRACDDARRAESLWTELVRVAGEGRWSSWVAQAKAVVVQACGDIRH